MGIEQRHFVEVNPRTKELYRRPHKQEGWLGVADGKERLLWYYPRVPYGIHVLLEPLLFTYYGKEFDELVQDWVDTAEEAEKELEALSVDELPLDVSVESDTLDEDEMSDLRSELLTEKRAKKNKGRVTFLNHKGRPYDKPPKAGTTGYWGIITPKGEARRIQLPKELGNKMVPQVQKFHTKAFKQMQHSYRMHPDGEFIVALSTTNRVTSMQSTRGTMLLRFDRFGRDTGRPEMMAYAMMSPYEKAMLARPSMTVQYEKWSDWFELDADKSVRESLGNLVAEVPKKIINEVRKRKKAFFEAQVEIKMDGIVLNHTVDLIKDTEMIWKRIAKGVVDKMASVGFKWTRTKRIKGYPTVMNQKFYYHRSFAGAKGLQPPSVITKKGGTEVVATRNLRQVKVGYVRYRVVAKWNGKKPRRNPTSVGIHSRGLGSTQRLRR